MVSFNSPKPLLFSARKCHRYSTHPKLTLAFLRKANRDRHTTRTFEDPCLRAAFNSERTDEVLGYFEEGRGDRVFDSVDELKDKARYYLKHEAQRQDGRGGRPGSGAASPYSNTDHLQTILRSLFRDEIPI